MSIRIIMQKAVKVKAIVTDVDGVLTDGFVYIDENSEEAFGKYSILDGLGIKMARECSVKIIAVSGRKSTATEVRCKRIGMDMVYTGILNKKTKLLEICEETNLALDEIAYIGDDLIDLAALSIVGLSCAPRTAVPDVLKRVNYVSPISGGKGVLRDVLELVLKAQGKYTQILTKYLA